MLGLSLFYLGREVEDMKKMPLVFGK